MTASFDKDPPNLGLLIKCLKMTQAENDGQALNAMRAANKQLAKFGGDWEALITGKVKIIGDPFANLHAPEHRAKAPPRPVPTPPPPLDPDPFKGYQNYQRNYQRTPRPSPSPQPPPYAQKTVQKTIVNKYDQTCVKCGNTVPAGHGLAKGWGTSSASKLEWKTEHDVGQCPPTRHHKPASSPGDFA